MATLQVEYPALPLGLYVQRVGRLVQAGELEASGNVEFMRLSEVRLPEVGAGVA